jgi:hypothetical protein
LSPSRDVNVIGTNWVFKNKQGEDGEIVRNKARLVAQGFSQVEGLDFEKTFAYVAHIEAIMILLAFAAYKGLKLYQIDVKSAFLIVSFRRKCMLDNPQVSRTPSISIWCTIFQRLCMGLSKHRGHGMLGLRHFCWSMGIL